MVTVKSWQIVGLCLGVLLVHVVCVRALDDCPPPEETDTVTEVIDFGDGERLGPISNFAVNEQSVLGADTAAIASLLTSQGVQSAWDDGSAMKAEASAVLNDMAEIDPGDATKLSIDFLYYKPTCPHLWYLLRRYYWYWRIQTFNFDGSVTYTYCFSFWWVWATKCPFKYCNVNYYPWTVWDLRYRCMPEYRRIYLPMRCYRVTIYNGQVVTGNWITSWNWMAVWVPRGCGCKKYWPWVSSASNVCPAP